MRELMQIASRLGVRVHVAHIDNPNRLGFYSHKNRVIVLRLGLTPFELRSVLAHELIHASWGDECGGTTDDKKMERRADRLAAEMLVSPEAYAAAEFLDPSPAAIADELGVTVEIIETYQSECLQRLGRRTYGRSWRNGLHGDLARQLSS